MSHHSRLSGVLLLALLVVVLGAVPVSAHTGFGSSDPTDGSTVDSPVETITIEFTGAAEPTGNGFEVLEPSGEIRSPDSLATADGSTWVLSFDPPLSGGVIGVRWAVKAPDAHPIEGSFSFTTPEAVHVSTSQPTDSATRPATVAPLTSPAAAADDQPASDTSSSQDATESSPAQAPVQAAPSRDLAEFLDTGGSTTALPRQMGAIARVITLAGGLIGVGALIFAAAVVRGDHSDVRLVLHWVRRAGLVVVVGAAAEFIAQIAVEAGGDWSAFWEPEAVVELSSSTFGIAVALRIVGGLALAAGARTNISHASTVPDPVVAIREQVRVGAGADPGPRVDVGGPDRACRSGEPHMYDGDQAWHLTIDSSAAVIGAMAIVAAHFFDGHTVTKGNRAVTAFADGVHVLGGAVWAGGVLMLVAVLWRRHRQGRELRALQLAVRFSVLATLAVGAVGLAGGALAVIVLDSPSELWGTQWGRTLVAKTVLAAAAGAAGAYNHRVLIPRLQLTTNDVALAHRFRTIVTYEALALAGVLVATALLIGAAS